MRVQEGASFWDLPTAANFKESLYTWAVIGITVRVMVMVRPLNCACEGMRILGVGVGSELDITDSIQARARVKIQARPRPPQPVYRVRCEHAGIIDNAWPSSGASNQGCIGSGAVYTLAELA